MDLKFKHKLIAIFLVSCIVGGLGPYISFINTSILAKDEINEEYYEKHNPKSSDSTIYIYSDFTFTSDIYEPIEVMADDIVIDGNGYTLQVLDGNIGFNLYNRRNVSIKNVSIKGHGMHEGGKGIYVSESSYINISGNTITDYSYGIYVSESSYFNISGNKIINGLIGIVSHYFSNSLISGNHISVNCYGMFADYTSESMISGNIISNNRYGLFLLYDSSNNKISGNIIKNNLLSGIMIQACSINNIISENIIIYNLHSGIRIHGSTDNNMIFENAITNNGVGILISNSKNNLIYHNNLIDNTQQATDNNPIDNDWHHPDLLEGNYWSNYPGFDDGSGTGKHEIAGDGIGDTDIPWPSIDYDNYPFTNKNGWKIIPATIDFDPDTLNLKSKGKWVTVYIELPIEGGYDVSEIIIESLLLNGLIAAEVKPTEISDYGDDGIPDLMVKFNRKSVQAILIEGENIEITITGELFNGQLIKGTDVIRVI